MIKCNEGHVVISGTGEEILKEWICLTASLHEEISGDVGVENANALLTKGLFAAVGLLSGKEG